MCAMAASCSPCWAGWERARTEEVRGEAEKTKEKSAYNTSTTTTTINNKNKRENKYVNDHRQDLLQ